MCPPKEQVKRHETKDVCNSAPEIALIHVVCTVHLSDHDVAIAIDTAINSPCKKTCNGEDRFSHYMIMEPALIKTVYERNTANK